MRTCFASLFALFMLTSAAHGQTDTEPPCQAAASIDVPDANFAVDVPRGYFWQLDLKYNTITFYPASDCNGRNLMIHLPRTRSNGLGAPQQAEKNRQFSIKGWKTDATPLVSVSLKNGARVHYYIGIDDRGKSGLLAGLLEYGGSRYYFSGHPLGEGSPRDSAIVRPWLNNIFGRVRPKGGGAAAGSAKKPAQKRVLRPIKLP